MAIRWASLAVAAIGLGLGWTAPHALAANAPAVPPVPAPGAAAPKVEIVLDSSGAMLNPIEAYKKYYWIRKSLITQFATPQQNPAVAAGLIAYGFQKQQACDDAAVVAPIQPFDAGKFLGAVSTVRPRGAAPVSEALKQAAAALGQGGGRVLLIAGGADSCQQDPCATAKDLVAAEPGLAIDVLSVGASDADLKQLQCIASSGNGTVFAATTMADSPKAFAQAFANLAVPPAMLAPTPPPPPPVANASGLSLSAQLAVDGPITSQPINWIVRAMDNGKPGAVVFRGAAPAALAPLQPGSYDVEASSGLIDRHQAAEVTEGKSTSLTLVLNAASLRLRVTAATPAKPDDLPQDTTFTVLRLASDPNDDTPDAALTSLRDPVTAPLLVPAGTFQVVASRGTLREEHKYTLAAGQDQVAEFSLASGKLAIESDATADPKLQPVYYVSEDDPDQPLGLRDLAQSAAPNPVFDLPPGLYHVSAQGDAGRVRQDAIVKAGETTKLVMPVSTGRLRLETAGLPGNGKLPDDLASYTIQRLDDAGAPLALATRGSGSQATIELATGSYRVTGRIGLVNVAATTDVTVKPGAESKAVLMQHVGLLDLRYGDEAAAGAGVLWEIRDAGQKILWSTTVPSPVVALAPGTYSVHALRLGKDQSMDVALATGERKAVAFQPE